MTPYQSTRLVNDLLQIVADKYDATTVELGELLHSCKHGFRATDEAWRDGTLVDEATALVLEYDEGKLEDLLVTLGRDELDALDQLDLQRNAVGDVLKAQSDLVLERRRQDAKDEGKYGDWRDTSVDYGL